MLETIYKQNSIEAGCDEAGRGCLSGPVYAAAVIFPADYKNNLIDDSKKITEKTRYKLRKIIEKEAIAWAVGIVDNNEIDKINILNASILAMHKSLDDLKITPNHIIIDGNKFKQYKDIPHETIVKGDSKFLSIAAASILAKTYRDDYMVTLHPEFPEYGWDKNKGYPTKIHIAAVLKYGQTKYHRKSYHLKSQQLSLSFK